MLALSVTAATSALLRDWAAAVLHGNDAGTFRSRRSAEVLLAGLRLA